MNATLECIFIYLYLNHLDHYFRTDGLHADERTTTPHKLNAGIGGRRGKACMVHLVNFQSAHTRPSDPTIIVHPSWLLSSQGTIVLTGRHMYGSRTTHITDAILCKCTIATLATMLVHAEAAEHTFPHRTRHGESESIKCIYHCEFMVSHLCGYGSCVADIHLRGIPARAYGDSVVGAHRGYGTIYMQRTWMNRSELKQNSFRICGHIYRVLGCFLLKIEIAYGPVL
jgi:hypothetical protein